MSAPIDEPQQSSPSVHGVAVPTLRLCVVTLALVAGAIACAAVVVGVASLAAGGGWGGLGAFLAGLAALALLVVAGASVAIARSLRRRPRASGILAAVLGVGIAYATLSAGVGRMYERPVLDLAGYAVGAVLLALGLLVAATSSDA